MREIKFRAWDSENKRMVVDFFIRDGKAYTREGNAACGDPECCGPFEYYDEEHDWKLMQYTGLKDAKGTPIYEGDIVKTSWKERSDGKIESYTEIVPELNAYHWFSELEDMDVEVIGNIYSNPDKLK